MHWLLSIEQNNQSLTKKTITVLKALLTPTVTLPSFGILTY